jgi:hypothetical protein
VQKRAQLLSEERTSASALQALLKSLAADAE